MPPLRYTSAALDDLVEIAAYIATSNGSVEAGERFAADIRGKCASLASLPGTLGRPRPELLPDIRSSPFKGYIIFFRYVEGVLEVVNVLERHRDSEQNFREG